jgi:cytidine deaminase
MRALRHSGRYFVGTSCEAASGKLFVAAERHATTAHAWLAA